MKRVLQFVFILLCLLTPCQAQEMPAPSQNNNLTNLPQWLVDFSNLPRVEREHYLLTFNKAKVAYMQGQWVLCIGHLADCEMIFRGNPNIWNLRASCLMEQKYFEEAAEELQRARKALPNDPVTIMNQANLHLVQGHYQESINTIHELRNVLPYETPQELIYILDFRELICLVMLGRQEEARNLVKELNSMSDTPLYYFSQAVFALASGNRMEATRNLRVANNIFSKGNVMVPFQRVFDLSGIAHKAIPGTENK